MKKVNLPFMSVPPIADHLCGQLYTKHLPNLWVTSDGFLGYIKHRRKE